MHPSVAAAWPAFCRRYEGVTTWMYLDPKGKVTTGVGFLIDTVAEAQALPWRLKITGGLATPAEVEREWHAVKALQSWKVYNGLAARWQNRSSLRLHGETVDGLLRDMTPRYWSGPAKAIPGLEQAPADAQLAVLDMSWQNGPAFLNAGTVWKGTRAALLAGDYAAAASHVPGTGDRANRRTRLFRNAAEVVRLGLHEDMLWDTTPITAPPKPPEPIPPAPPAPAPASTPAPPTPEVPPVKLSQTKRKQWKGSRHYVDERTHAQLEAVEEILGHPIVMYLGSWANGSLSANTHAGAGAADIGPTGGVTWRQLEAACRAVGLAAWWRNWTGNVHVHVLSIGNSRLASWAKVQVEAYLAGFDGLGANARSGRDTGPRAHVRRTWEDVQEDYSMPDANEVADAVVKKLRGDDKLLDAIAERAAEKVWSVQVVGNEWSDKATNPLITGKTSLKRTASALVKLAAAVAKPAAPAPTVPPVLEVKP